MASTLKSLQVDRNLRMNSACLCLEIVEYSRILQQLGLLVVPHLAQGRTEFHVLCI